MKSVHFLENIFSMTKKRKKKVVRIFFRELKGTFKDFFLKIYFQKIFDPPIFVTQIFAPPNIYDKSTPLPTCTTNKDKYIYCLLLLNVFPVTFNRRVVGSPPALAATEGPWASPLPAVACALRRETPIQYPCCSRKRL